MNILHIGNIFNLGISRGSISLSGKNGPNKGIFHLKSEGSIQWQDFEVGKIPATALALIKCR